MASNALEEIAPNEDDSPSLTPTNHSLCPETGTGVCPHLPLGFGNHVGQKNIVRFHRFSAYLKAKYVLMATLIQ